MRRVVIQLDVTGFGQYPNIGWSIYANGSGTFDLWLTGDGFINPVTVFGQPRFIPGDNDKSVAIPSTAKKLISVGAYVTKTQWVDLGGTTRTQTGATLDAISDFSSLGPSLDGRTLPHLAAPGEAVVAALASTVSPPSTEILQGGGMLKLQGTSMASPHVTGVVALMLERNRYLSPENARALLQQSATATGGPANTWGAGRLNALAAMLLTPAPVPCGTPGPYAARTEDCEEHARDVGPPLEVHPNPSPRAATVAFRLPAPARVHLAVYDLLGREVRTLRDEVVTGGYHQLVWDGTNDAGGLVPSGVYFTRLVTPTRTAMKRLVLVK
jgi:hypothetical protein